MSTKKKPILCLDFDGVIHSYTSGWQGADEVNDDPVPGALEFLYEANNDFEIHIYSSRSHQKGGIEAMQEWLRMHLEDVGAPFVDAFVDKIVKWPTNKPSAMITIDDRALTFTGEWPKISELLNFKPWNKK